MSNRRYCIITPCRDEAKYAHRTLDSVAAQTIKPTRWIIVDDGSTDATPKILAEYAEKYEWITVIRREDRGGRKVGPGVIEAFYAGYETIDPNDYDYLCKLDLDLELPPGYFEELMKRMEAEPRIGSCSGKPYYPPATMSDEEHGPAPWSRERFISEGCGDETSIGASKFYRRTCFQQLGGFVREVMWDAIDCHRARKMGWIICSWDCDELRFLHLRPMGSSQKGILTGRMRHGYGQWFMGTSLIYMTASAIFRMSKRPLVIGGLAMWWGYVRSMLTLKPRYGDRELRRFIRKYQWQALLHGKAAAVAAIQDKQAAVWQPPDAS